MSRREDSQHDGWVKHAGLSSRIPGAKSDVDIRIYGCLNLNSVVAKSDGFQTRKDSGLTCVRSKSPTHKERLVFQCVASGWVTNRTEAAKYRTCAEGIGTLGVFRHSSLAPCP